MVCACGFTHTHKHAFSTHICVVAASMCYAHTHLCIHPDVLDHCLGPASTCFTQLQHRQLESHAQTTVIRVRRTVAERAEVACCCTRQARGGSDDTNKNTSRAFERPQSSPSQDWNRDGMTADTQSMQTTSRGTLCSMQRRLYYVYLAIWPQRWWWTCL